MIYDDKKLNCSVIVVFGPSHRAQALAWYQRVQPNAALVEQSVESKQLLKLAQATPGYSIIPWDFRLTL